MLENWLSNDRAQENIQGESNTSVVIMRSVERVYLPPRSNLNTSPARRESNRIAAYVRHIKIPKYQYTHLCPVLVEIPNKERVVIARLASAKLSGRFPHLRTATIEQNMHFSI